MAEVNITLFRIFNNNHAAKNEKSICTLSLKCLVTYYCLPMTLKETDMKLYIALEVIMFQLCSGIGQLESRSIIILSDTPKQ